MGKKQKHEHCTMIFFPYRIKNSSGLPISRGSVVLQNVWDWRQTRDTISCLNYTASFFEELVLSAMLLCNITLILGKTQPWQSKHYCTIVQWSSIALWCFRGPGTSWGSGKTPVQSLTTHCLSIIKAKAYLSVSVSAEKSVWYTRRHKELLDF